MKADRVALVPDERHDGDWRVETFGEDGECYVAIFTGPRALERAEVYRTFLLPAQGQKEGGSESDD